MNHMKREFQMFANMMVMNGMVMTPKMVISIHLIPYFVCKGPSITKYLIFTLPPCSLQFLLFYIAFKSGHVLTSPGTSDFSK